MKTKVYLIAAVALAFSACTTGSYVSTGYVDDIYFNPADIPPPVVAEEMPGNQAPEKAQSPDRVIISEITGNQEGSKTMNNYIFDGKETGTYADAQMYNLDQMDLENSDTTVYYDDNEIKYVINNYYEGEDVDFTRRIRMFHRPYFYDPFYWNDWYWNDMWYWDSWYYPYSSMSWGWGYSPWYSGWYGGWYGGMYGGWYSPWYSPYGYYGWGGYGYPGYAYGGGYYNDYWGGRYYNSEDYRYGKRRDYGTTVSGGTRGGGGAVSSFSNERSGLKSTSPQGTTDHINRRANSVSGAENGGRSVRQGTSSQTEASRGTLTEMRRNNVDASATRSRNSGTTVSRNFQNVTPSNSRTVTGSAVQGNSPQSQGTVTRRYSGSQMQYTRPSSTPSRSSNSYTPSYNQQRSASRSTYNIQGTSRPSTSSGNDAGQLKNAQRSSTVYSRPSGSSGSDRSYRSGSTYNRSSSSGENVQRSYTPSSSGSRSTYSSPGRSSGSSYSAPSYSSGSSGSSGSYSGGGSSGGGGYSGGGGGGSSSGGGSSHSGRR